MRSDQARFERIADKLTSISPDDDRYAVLAALMDKVGVPMAALARYADDPTIMRLFADRGVTFTTVEAQQKAAKAAAGLRAIWAPGHTPMS